MRLRCVSRARAAMQAGPWCSFRGPATCGLQLHRRRRVRLWGLVAALTLLVGVGTAVAQMGLPAGIAQLQPSASSGACPITLGTVPIQAGTVPIHVNC